MNRLAAAVMAALTMLSGVGRATEAGTPTIAPSHAVAPPAARATVDRSPAALRRSPTLVEHHVDLNRASTEELMTLPGIGPAEARRIVSHRPYLTKTELVTKEVLAVGPFLSIKNRVVAMPLKPPGGKPAKAPVAGAR